MPRSTWREIGETVRALGIAVLVALFIRSFIVETFQVHGTSMEPNLWNGERLLVNKFVYRFSPPKIGQIIIFHPTVGVCPEVGLHPDDFVKRVIALAGDTVYMSDGQVYVDGKLQSEPYLPAAYRDTYSMPPKTVPAGDVWVLGDHRLVSLDSRCYGPVPIRSIVGQVMLVWWPFSKAHVIQS